MLMMELNDGGIVKELISIFGNILKIVLVVLPQLLPQIILSSVCVQGMEVGLGIGQWGECMGTMEAMRGTRGMGDTEWGTPGTGEGLEEAGTTWRW